MKNKASLSCLILAALAAIPSHAAITGVSTRPALSGNEYIDWGTAGPEFSYLGSSFGVFASGGMPVLVSAPVSITGMERVDEGSSWFGNFGLGDELLWTGLGHYGPITLDPLALVRGVGAQIQLDDYTSFTARIEAFAVGGASLGVFDLGGLSTGAEDNSAIFIGLLSDLYDIDKVEFSILSTAGDPALRDFAINQVDLLTREGNPVPEVQTYATFLGFGLMGLEALRRRRQAQRS